MSIFTFRTTAAECAGTSACLSHSGSTKVVRGTPTSSSTATVLRLPPKLFFTDDGQVFDISVENGTITIGIYKSYDCYNQSGHQLGESYPYTRLMMGVHYTLLDTRIKLTVFGCDTSTLISDAAGTFRSRCSSYCREDINFIAEGACSGLGCCQTFIPNSIRSLNISMNGMTNYMSVHNFGSCGSAFIVDQESFDVSYYKLPVSDDMGNDVFSRVVVDWVVEWNLT
ncbi:hypothetical protein NL676_025420 [Syzygium grande]|nr:hypothetical protein NL676_025420 [Syzygium grande]